MPERRADHVHELRAVGFLAVILALRFASVGMQVTADAVVLADLSPAQA
jgi:hypothetical protein